MLKTERISLTVTCPLMRVGLKLCLQPLCKNLFPAYGFIFIKNYIIHFSCYYYYICFKRIYKRKNEQIIKLSKSGNCGK